MMKSFGSASGLIPLAGVVAALLACGSSDDTASPQGMAGDSGTDASDGAASGSSGAGGDAAAGTGGNAAVGGSDAEGAGGAAGVGGAAGGSGGAGVGDAACDGDCNPAPCSGDFIIRSSADFAAFVTMACRQVTGNLRITQTELTSLDGLVIESIGGEVTIALNSMLTSLSGLERITHIGGNLSVVQNEKLPSLAPLGTWPADAVGRNLSIFNNTALPQCEVDKLDAHLTANCNSCVNNGTGTCL
jgi:hypothetical protein